MAHSKATHWDLCLLDLTQNAGNVSNMSNSPLLPPGFWTVRHRKPIHLSGVWHFCLQQRCTVRNVQEDQQRQKVVEALIGDGLPSAFVGFPESCQLKEDKSCLGFASSHLPRSKVLKS